MWLSLLGFLLFCLLFSAPFSTARAASDSSANIFFVATNGNDAWSGRIETPNRTRTDGPFATLKKAVEISQEKDASGSGTGRRPTIFIRAGIHFLDQPLVLTTQHSGLSLAAYKEEKPVISGGKQITGWKLETIQGKKAWVTDLPQVRDGKWFFHEVWVNGRRATRARHPNHGYLGIAEVPDATPEWEKGQTRFRFKEGDLKNFKTVTNAELVAMTRWVESRLPIQAVDEQNRMVSFSKKSVFQLATGDPYYVENYFEALDEPGEWYLDRYAGKLYYLPRAGEQPDEVQVIAPVLTQLFRLEGQSDSPQSVQQVTFKGLTFSHNEWYFPEGFAARKDKPKVSPEPAAEVGGFSQAAIGVPAAVSAAAANHCSFDHCTFAHIGSYALELGRACKSNQITHCDFFDLGAGGLKIGETAIPEKMAEVSAGNVVSDCRIYDGGKMFHSAIGVWVGQSPANEITHNLIHDFYYTGISIGWTWGYGPSCASNNLVQFNHVHHIGVRSDGDGPILSDMGGIYTLGKEPGTRIVNNLWHDIAGIHYGGWGIYLDEGSSGILVESNLVYNTTHGGFHQHYGETNLVMNNIFAFARDHQLQRSRVEPHPSFTFATNIVYFDSGVLLGGDWSGDQYGMDYNLYWDSRIGAAATNAITFAGASLEKWRERGHDAHSIVADPLFISPKSHDFQLEGKSPAFHLGFRPPNLKLAGPR